MVTIVLNEANMNPVQPMESLPELIVCSAAKNPLTGEVYISLRHGDDYFWQHHDSQYGDKVSCMDYEQGFITNKHRFVSREEAYEIALANSQIRRLCPTGSKRLYSEMLY